jgi:hypothetical protein
MQDNQYEMLEKQPRLKDALSIEEHVLGCMWVSMITTNE